MKTLIVVDMQNDFLPGGALAVAGGNEIVSIINSIMPKFELVVATQDWHPANHGSFAANHPGKKVGEVIKLGSLDQVLWPVHCVQGTPGANIVSKLNTSLIQHTVRKGTDPGIDSYSAFFDNGGLKSTGLAENLREEGSTVLCIVGLATDYCVKFTALDAIKQGFKTVLVSDACRGVNLKPGDVERAIAEMRQAGVVMVNSQNL